MNTQNENSSIERKHCVRCFEMIHTEAKICPHCQSNQTQNYWMLALNFLKWIGGITAIISLLIGITQVNRILINWHEKGAAVSQLVKATKIRYRLNDFESAWNLTNEALNIDPTNKEARDIQVELTMSWIRHAYKFDDEKISKELYPVLFRGAASDNKSLAADAMAHLALLDYKIKGTSANRSKVEKQLKRALKIDKNNVYANAIWGYLQVRFDPKDREETIDNAMHLFDIALQSNRDNHFVRKNQFGALFGKKHNAKVIQLANDVRIKGEDLPLETYWTILKRYENLWNSPYDKLVLQSLPPEDLLNTYLWLEAEVDLAYESQFRYKFVKGRLNENAGDMKAAAQLYRELMEFIDTRKDWQKRYKNECKEKTRKQLEIVSSEL